MLPNTRTPAGTIYHGSPPGGRDCRMPFGAACVHGQPLPYTDRCLTPTWLFRRSSRFKGGKGDHIGVRPSAIAAFLAVVAAAAAAPAYAQDAQCAGGEVQAVRHDGSTVCVREDVADQMLLAGWIANITQQVGSWVPQPLLDFTEGMMGGGMVQTNAMSKAVTAGSMGLSVGGAKDVNNFRENIVNGYLPLPTDVTYEGLFYDYYFDTGNATQCGEIFCPAYGRAVVADPLSGETERYITVGLNSNITEADFERDDLNLVIVLDVSGSMGSQFDSYYYDGPDSTADDGRTKMQIANEAVAGLLDRLGPEDRLGVVLFNDGAHVARPLEGISETDVGPLKHEIREIYSGGGTNMEAGMRTGTSLFGGAPGPYWCSSDGKWCVDDPRSIECYCPEGNACPAVQGWCIDSLKSLLCACHYGACPDAEGWCLMEGPKAAGDGRANRIIFLTDAMPNTGEVSEGGLFSMVRDNAGRGIHTTFVGIGVDFNTELVEELTKIRGANYYSVHSAGEFNERMVDEFDLMVTPLVFDLRLTLESGGYGIDRVYGSPEADLATGDIMRVNTLFPSRAEDGEVRGGIILLRLNGTGDHELTLRTAYENADGSFGAGAVNVTMQDAISYDNDGIRKGILLAKYADLLKAWIHDERASLAGAPPVRPPHHDYIYAPEHQFWPLGQWERQSVPLHVSERYAGLFAEFRTHFEAEMDALGDGSLEREIEILDMLAGWRG